MQHVGGSLSVQRSVVSWLSLPQVIPGRVFLAGETFDVQDLVSEMKMFLHGLGQAGS